MTADADGGAGRRVGDVAAPAAPLGVEELGDGSPLVCVHGGLLGGRLAFGGLAPVLAARHRVLVVDRPGFERTGGAGAPVAEQAERLLATIRARAAAPCHAMATWSGGLVLLRALQEDPSAFASATLVEVPAAELCPADLVEVERLLARLRGLRDAAPEAAFADLLAAVDPPLWAALEGLVRRGDPGVTALAGDLAVGEAGLERMRLADAVGGDRPIPVLAVSGGRSHPAFRTFGASTAAALAGRHVVLDGAGHAAHLHPGFPPLLAEHVGLAGG